MAVVVLNWNGWRDTVRCLDGLLALNEAPRQIIVCDNGSTDGSIAALQDWARRVDHVWRQGRPLRWARFHASGSGPVDAAAAQLDLVLLCLDANLGFGAGLNAGLRWALRSDDVEHVWLLNNDTVPEPHSLRELTKAAQTKPECGVFGSTIVHYDDDTRVLGHFGVLNPGWVRTRHAAMSPSGTEPVLQLGRWQYPIGAALLMTRAAAQRSGGLAEDYFLYFEELDLVHRLRPALQAAVVLTSLVRHREAAATGAAAGGGSLVADYCFTRARVLFARRFYRWCVPTVVLAVVATALGRVVRGRFANASAVSAGLWDGVCGRGGAKRARRWMSGHKP